MLTVNLCSVGNQLFTPMFVIMDKISPLTPASPESSPGWVGSLVFTLQITFILKCIRQEKDPCNNKSVSKTWGLETDLLGASGGNFGLQLLQHRV